MALIWFIFVCTFYLIWLETCYLLCNTIYLLTIVIKKTGRLRNRLNKNEEINETREQEENECHGTTSTTKNSTRITKNHQHMFIFVPCSPRFLPVG